MEGGSSFPLPPGERDDSAEPSEGEGASKHGRIATLDAVRGFAVMGILLLNIVDFGLPTYAYVDPNYYGGAAGADWWTWASVYALFDGKMRGLFTMMFGASTLLIADRALAAGESPARVHFARMGWLFVFGMIHAYLIWSGDILTLYAVCGALMFAVWRWRTRALFALAAVLLGVRLVTGLAAYAGAARYEAAAGAPNATPALRAEWRAYRDEMAPPSATAADDLRAYRGSWTDAFRARAAWAAIMQTVVLPIMVPDTLALIALGMALFRTGFFSGEWSDRRYRQAIVAGLCVLPLYVPLILWIDATRFSPVTLLATEAIQLSLLRPVVAIGWASAVVLFTRSGWLPALAARLTAAGRMAFSNYLGTSLVCTLIFNGYGLGWYGDLERFQLYGVVLLVWALILAWSQPWLARFHYGPFEWLWRRLARGPTPLLRTISN